MINERYNKYKKCLISLEEGEEFCTKCKGEGIIVRKRRSGLFRNSVRLCCSKCNGDGKVDWVEKATGKKRRFSGTNQQGPPASYQRENTS